MERVMLTNLRVDIRDEIEEIDSEEETDGESGFGDEEEIGDESRTNGENTIGGENKIDGEIGIDGKESLSLQVPLANFTLFPKLPTEIQDIIWKCALEKPRQISVDVRHYMENEDLWRYLQGSEKYTDIDNQSQSDVKNLSRQPVQYDEFTEDSIRHATTIGTSIEYPTLLRVCHQARDVGLANYQKVFYLSMGLKPIYIDFSRDFLRFQDVHSILMFLGMKFAFDVTRIWQQDLHSIPKLLPESKHVMEKNLRSIAFGGILAHPLMDILPRFEKLEKILVRKDYLSLRGNDNSAYILLGDEINKGEEYRAKKLMKKWQDVADTKGYKFKEPVLGLSDGRILSGDKAQHDDFKRWRGNYYEI